MDMKNTLTLANWLNGRASLEEVLSTDPIGIVGNERFSKGQARRAFILAWEWSAHRFSGQIAKRQEALWTRHGPEFVNRRIARCKRMVARFLGR
jgi:hypothetical protein